ncbi:MAG: ArsR/SmtB family transcription factor [Lachnospirales bacterium]
MKDFEENVQCDAWCQHNNFIDEVNSSLPELEKLYDLAEFFKVFGDSTRIRILYALSIKELCVCDIATVLNVSQSAVSHQLRVLKHNKLVKFKREGKSIFYSLDDNHIENILKQGLNHINE